MPLYETILQAIGRTPLVRLTRIAGDCPAVILGKAENAGKTIVALLPDTGRNYLSKIYNDDWMRDNNLLDAD
jgi:cysteine synthase